MQVHDIDQGSVKRKRRWRLILRWVAGLVAIFGSVVALAMVWDWPADIGRVEQETGAILATTITLGLCVGLYIISRTDE